MSCGQEHGAAIVTKVRSTLFLLNIRHKTFIRVTTFAENWMIFSAYRIITCREAEFLGEGWYLCFVIVHVTHVIIHVYVCMQDTLQLQGMPSTPLKTYLTEDELSRTS